MITYGDFVLQFCQTVLCIRQEQYTYYHYYYYSIISIRSKVHYSANIAIFLFQAQLFYDVTDFATCWFNCQSSILLFHCINLLQNRINFYFTLVNSFWRWQFLLKSIARLVNLKVINLSVSSGAIINHYTVTN